MAPRASLALRLACSAGLASGFALACTGLTGLSSADDPGAAGTDGAIDAEAQVLRDGGASSKDADAATCAANLTSDAKNCGRCGRDCLGAACNSGMCEAITLAPALSSPSAIFLTADAVFFTTEDDGRVQSVPKAGGVITTYVSGEFQPRGVAVAGTTLFWANDDHAYDDAGTTRGGIWSCELPACAAPSIVESADEAMEPVVRDGDVYFGSADQGQLYRTSLATHTTVLIGRGASTNLAVDDTYAYHSGPGALLRVLRASDGSAPDVTILGGAGGSGFIALDDTRIFWAFIDGAGGGHVISFSKASPATGSLEYGTPKNNRAPIGVAVDDVNVYWATAGTDNGPQTLPAGDGQVLYCPKIGCGPTGPTALANGNVEAGPLATDDKALYWAEIGTENQTNGRLRKVAKP